MSEGAHGNARRRARLPLVMIALTASACVAAIVFRTPIRARYWAARIIAAESPETQVPYVNLLMHAGDGSRWGTARLLDHRDARVRRYGVLILRSMTTAWARQRLLAALKDPEESIRNLAAASLAFQGDDTVIPVLTAMYRSNDDAAAETACLALERLASPAAVEALAALARAPGSERQSAALIDAFQGISIAACVPPLLSMLTDHRPCPGPPRSARVALDWLRRSQADGALPFAVPEPEAEPEQTIAERAARALVRITGIDPRFSSSMSAEARQQAAMQWADWHAAKTERP